VVRTFEDTFAFGGKRTNRTDSNWRSLIPYGGGFVPVRDAEKYGLQHDERQGDSPLYGVSVFHQLHCLVSFCVCHKIANIEINKPVVHASNHSF
jgi:hypothetical protein